MQFTMNTDFALKAFEAIENRETVPTPRTFDDVLALAAACIHSATISAGVEVAKAAGGLSNVGPEFFNLPHAINSLVVYQSTLVAALTEPSTELPPYELRGRVLLDSKGTIEAVGIKLDSVSQAALDRIKQ